MDGLSLIIPALNEAANIRRAIEEADHALAGMAPDYEIIIVDDGSVDGTAEAVRAAAANCPRVRLVRHERNRGYGAALRTGFEAARFARVAFTDADCQFDLADLASLASLTERYSLAVGYRVDRQDNWRRRLMSRGYNVLVRGLLGTRVRDCDCALKVFRREALARLLPETSGFFVNAEMLTRARQLGYRLAEVGVRHRPRFQGNSKVSFREIPKTLTTLIPFWWSRVLFPGATSDAMPARPSGIATNAESRQAAPAWRPALGFWTLLVVAALLFFSRLRSPLLEPDEARYAEIPREMLAEGQFVLPVLHGAPYYHKPPLLYWLVMGSYALFGVEDWAARLVPCGAAFLTVLLTYAWGRRTVGPRAAFAGAMMLCLSARFVYLGRMLTLDSLLCLWVITAWAAAHAAVGSGRLRWRWWLASGVTCGLGLLTKGPVAGVLVGLPVLAWQLLDPRTARPRLGPWLTYLTAALVMALPWYAAVGVRDPQFLSEFFWTHNVLRFAAPLDHPGPVWYYLPGLLLGMLPWTLLLPPALKLLGRRSGAAAERRPAGLGLFLLAFLWCLVFYSAAGCKRPGYVLPVMPPLALALGCYLHAALPHAALGRKGLAATEALTRLAYRATLLSLILAAIVSVLTVVAEMQKPLTGFALAATALAALAYLMVRGPIRRVSSAWAVLGGVAFILLLTGLHQIQPSYARKFSLRAQVRMQRGFSLDPRVPVACYPHRWDSVSFYLGRDDIRVYTPESHAKLLEDLRQRPPEMLVFVKSDDPHARFLRDLERGLPASVEFVPLGRQSIITAGLIRRRAEVPSSLLARQ